MNLTLSKKISHETIILPVFVNEKISKKITELNKEWLTPKAIESDFKNQLGKTQTIYLGTARILILALGEKSKFTPIAWRTALNQAIAQLQHLDTKQVSFVLPEVSMKPEQLLELTGFGATFSSYSFNTYKKEKKTRIITDIEFVFKLKSAKLDKALETGRVIASAANQSRELANHPGNHITPIQLAKHAETLAKEYGFSCQVLGPKEIEQEKMGLLSGVARGSEEPARFIVLEYGPKKKPAIALIGKGLTFDSGGISIKPADRMEEMKYDMCGGADVLGIFEAVARLKLPVHLVGLIPSTENLISGKATKPGDILISKSGVSVEVINTDAEGRLILADAIDYAQAHFKPTLMIDYATLTGAVLVALGDEYTGYFSNTKKYDKAFAQASTKTGEKFWSLPMPEEYRDHVKSHVADIRNIGERGLAGATSGALFLEKFVDKTDWIHLDIAGTAWTMKPKPYANVGATAWGVYLTVELLRNLK